MTIKEVSLILKFKTHAVELNSGVTEMAMIAIIDFTCSPTSFAESFDYLGVLFRKCARNLI